MKAFVLKEPGVVGYEQVPEPVLTPYGAILKPVAVAPCSSDVHTVFGGGSRKAPNLVLGHECVARVLEVGEYVTDFVPGELVAVPAITPDWRAKSIQEHNFKHASAPFSGHQLGRTQPGVFSERFLIPDADTTLAKIPEGVSLEQALMCVDVVTTGFTGAQNADIKFGDTVVVIAGKDKDKTGKVLSVKGGKVLVEGCNMVTKHSKPNAANPQGGIVNQEAAMDISNVMLVVDGKATRVGFEVKDGKKVRVAKATGKVID